MRLYNLKNDKINYLDDDNLTLSDYYNYPKLSNLYFEQKLNNNKIII